MKIKVCGNTIQQQNANLDTFRTNGLDLKEVEVYKYLGLHIDSGLNFQVQHNKTVAYAQSKHFRRIRRYINDKAAKLIYKCTILPVIEYADFIRDQGIAYVNKAMQKLQNYGLSIVFNQHALQYDLKDSSETLHRKCNVFRLVHRRRLHLLQFAFRLKDNIDLIDNRDIPTRRHEGVVFKIPKHNHFKFLRNPYYRCMIEWNRLPVNISLIFLKNKFKQEVKATILNPYVKVL